MNNIKNFFKEKYARKSNFSPKHCEDFLKDISTPQLTAEEVLECEGPITKQDINECLQDMGNGKSPGNGGLTKEFYLIFLDSSSEDLLQCYDCCLEEESLNYFSNTGHNYISSKPGKDHIFIKSWRLISLLNVDLKILSKY